MAFLEQDATAQRGQDAQREVDLRGARAVSAELDVVVENDVREDRLELVRREVPPRTM